MSPSARPPIGWTSTRRGELRHDWVKEATWADEIINRTSAMYRQGATRRDRVDVNAVVGEMVALLRDHSLRAQQFVGRFRRQPLAAGVNGASRLDQFLVHQVFEQIR